MPIWDDVISAGERRAYEKAGWGGRVGFGQRPALLVTDMYRAFVDPAYPFSSETSVETASQIRILLEAFRRRSLPVFFSTERPAQNAADRGRWKVKAADGAQMTEAAAYEIWPDIAPVKGESVLVKTYPSAFFGTTLSSQLIYLSVDTLIVTGTVTSGCVRATCLDAFNYNFRVIVPQECVCDRGAASHKVALFEIDMKYGDVVALDEVLDYVQAVNLGPG
ncbi:MAG TPA: isochorismatase family protein [Candidatus Dormibacteraeota bacterium]|nr:isochorismatase family protein [Candidatus Dormibacteraeota bacterium]